MKKLVCVFLMLTIVLSTCSGVFAAREVYFETRLIKSVSELTDDEIMYQCSFKAELDSTFKKTWLYQFSENGTLNVTLTRGDFEVEESIGFSSEYLITFNKRGVNYGFFVFNSGVPFGAKGQFEFCEDENYVDESMGNTVRSYYPDPDSSENFILHLDLTNRDGVKEISLFMYDSYRGQQNYKYLSTTSTITVDMDTFTEKDKIVSPEEGDKASDYVFNVIRTNNNPKEFDENSEENRTSYRDENGVTHRCGTILGTFRGYECDYDVVATAKFPAYIRNSSTIYKLSTDGNIVITYYEIRRTMDDNVVHSANHFAKIEGDKGSKWFILSTIEVPNGSSGVIYQDNHTFNDSSIYVGFAPLDKFDGKRYEYTDTDTVMSLTFNYNDSSKSYLNSVTLEVDGVSGTVSFGNIDYSGKFVSGFLSMVFPDYDEKMKEMGLGK